MNKVTLMALLSAAGPAMAEPAPYDWYPEFSGDEIYNLIINTIKDNLLVESKLIENYLRSRQKVIFQLSCGDADDLVLLNQRLNMVLQQHGIPCTFNIHKGGHSIDLEERKINIVPFL